MNPQNNPKFIFPLTILSFVATASIPCFAAQAHDDHKVPSQEQSLEQNATQPQQAQERAVQDIEAFILLPSYQCVWRRNRQQPGTGGFSALCQAGELPFVAAATGEAETINCPLANLSPARGGDGRIDGERLANDHPHIHGEPIETKDNDLEDLNQRGKLGTTKHISPQYLNDDRCKPLAEQYSLALCCSKDFPFDEGPF